MEKNLVMRVAVVTAVVLLSAVTSTQALDPDQFNQRLLSLLLGVGIGFAILRVASVSTVASIKKSTRRGTVSSLPAPARPWPGPNTGQERSGTGIRE